MTMNDTEKGEFLQAVVDLEKKVAGCRLSLAVVKIKAKAAKEDLDNAIADLEAFIQNNAKELPLFDRDAA